ncbi:hypothetical protein FRB99_006488 [Tulasnella sp. 403]|nr:hypothetical protein FRB99_006488 [Tulasnella sp. 403]
MQSQTTHTSRPASTTPFGQGLKTPALPASPYHNFDLLKRVQLDHVDIRLEKWRSRKTGLSVVHLDHESPLVDGYFALRTEIFDDSGRPHTLEHLIFLGSEQYPYKGILDNLAKRAFSAGTNAWTDTDHTAYTITTAGQDGFLRLLPIYVDHILYPTMTDSGFVTEVHHINGKAEDAGVVYAEMQGREQTSGDLMAVKLQRAFYPTQSAYRSETGGLMEALRVLTAEKIREYHRTYYVPHNLCLIVTGRLPTSTLLDVVQKEVEPRLLEHGQTGPPSGWRRPFLETPSIQKPAISATVSQVVEFPEKDESQGEIALAYVGPELTDMLTRKAIDILTLYLGDSPVSPLQKTFVEIPSPLCTYIGFNENVRASYSSLEIYLGGVPTEELESFHGKLHEALKDIAGSEIDMARMRTVIKKDRLKFLNSMEAGTGEFYAPSLINDNRPVVVIGKPSATLPDKLETEEKVRIAAQKEKLGEAGLARLTKILDEAMAENSKPIPQDVLTSFPPPPVTSIPWIPVTTAFNDPHKDPTTLPANDVQRHVSRDAAELPFFVEFDHVKSKFVTISAYLSTKHVPLELLSYLNVYTACFYSLPVVRADGTRLSHEDVIQELDDFTVGYDYTLGYNDQFQDLIRFMVRVEVDQYAKVVEWMRDLIYGSEFTKDRLEITTAKALQSLPEFKRDGNNVLYSTSSDVLLDETSASREFGLLKQMEVLPRLAERLKDNPDAVIADFERIRNALTKPEGVRFSVVGNILDIPRPRTPWKAFATLPVCAHHIEQRPEYSSFQYAANSIRSTSIISGLIVTFGLNKKSIQAIVVTLPTIESSYALHVSKGVTGFKHKDQAALRVACEVLEGAESFLWKYIRGAGLAYGAGVSLDVEAGHLSFSVYQAPDSYRAFEEGKKVIQGLVDGSIVVDDAALDAAKSSLVFAQARSESTPGRAGGVSFLNQALKGVPQTFGQDIIADMQASLFAVTVSDVKEMLKTYILPLFDPATSAAIVVSSPAKASDIASKLEGAGFVVENRLLEASQDEDAESDEEGSGMSSGDEGQK